MHVYHGAQQQQINQMQSINSVRRGQGVPANKIPKQQQIVSAKGNGQIRGASATATGNVGNETPRTRERNAKRSLAPPVTVAAQQYQKVNVFFFFFSFCNL